MCSGSLISPFHVLTAGHCVWDSESSPGRWYDMSTYWVVPGQTDVQAPSAEDGWSRWGTDKPFGVARARNAYLWGYSSDPSFQYDYAVITLDRRIGEWTGTLAVASGLASGSTVHQRGYPGGDYNGVYLYNRTGYRVSGLRFSGREMLTDLFICGGDSGSPVLDSAGAVRGVAVGVYYTTPDPPNCGNSSSAKRLDSTAVTNLNSLVASGGSGPSWSPGVYEMSNPTWGPGMDALKGVAPPTLTEGAPGGLSLFFSLFNQGSIGSGALSLTAYYSPSDYEGAPLYWLGSWSEPAGVPGKSFRVLNFTSAALPSVGTWWVVAYYTYAGQNYTEDSAARTVVVGQVTVVPASRSPSRTPSAASTPSRSPSGTPSSSGSGSASPSGSATTSGTPSSQGTHSGSPSETSSRSGTRSPSDSRTCTPSQSPSGSLTPSASVTPFPTGTGTETGSVGASPTTSVSLSASPSGSPTGSVSPVSPSDSRSASSSDTPSGSLSGSPSGTATRTASRSQSVPPSPSGSLTGTRTPSPTGSRSLSPTASATPSRTRSLSASGTPFPTRSRWPTWTGTSSLSPTSSGSPSAAPLPHGVAAVNVRVPGGPVSLGGNASLAVSLTAQEQLAGAVSAAAGVPRSCVRVARLIEETSGWAVGLPLPAGARVARRRRALQSSTTIVGPRLPGNAQAVWRYVVSVNLTAAAVSTPGAPSDIEGLTERISSSASTSAWASFAQQFAAITGQSSVAVMFNLTVTVPLVATAPATSGGGSQGVFGANTAVITIAIASVGGSAAVLGIAVYAWWYVRVLRPAKFRTGLWLPQQQQPAQ